MEWLQLLLSAVVGAVAGALASIGTATRIARGNELGRVQEQSRQRMLVVVREWRAQVLADRVDASWRMAMGSEYLRADRGLRFAEAMEHELVHAPTRHAGELRSGIRTLVGPVDALVARSLYPVALPDRSEHWRTIAYLQSAEALSDQDQSDRGLIGKARDAPLIGEHVKDIIVELDRMEATINGWRVGLWRK